MGKLEQKVAIVTGGGTGIGRTIALEMAKAGAEVVVSSRNLANLEKVASEIKSLGSHPLTAVTDVSVGVQVRNMVQQTVATFGRVDILVNNAGISHRTLLVDLSEEEWDNIMATNVKGVFLCIQAAAKQMMKQKYGKIINIASIAGLRPARPGTTAYCTSKAAVISLTKASAIELAPYGINVNAIAPGSIETEIYRRGRTEEQIQQWLDAARRAPMGSVGEPQDIANAALFLASDDSSFLCGETIVVDGGRNALMA